jgi:hypothetical protein
MATVCLAVFLMLTAAKLVVAVVRFRRWYRGPVQEQKKPQSHAALRFDFTQLADQRGFAGAGRVDVGRACEAGVGLAAGAVAAGAGFAAGAGAAGATGGAAGAGLAEAV